MTKILKFFYVAAMVLLTGYVSSALTDIGLETWYNGLDKPYLTPQNALCPIMWTILYALMIIAVFLALDREHDKGCSKINNIFLTQLLLQIVWCLAFFAKGQIGLGLIIIIALDIAVYRLLQAVKPLGKLPVGLLYPYYIWLLFATLLNISYLMTYGMDIL